MSNDAPLKRSPITWVPTLYFAEGLPFYAVAFLAGQMYQSLGAANDQVAHWTGLIGLAWAFKPLWSPFLELARSKKALVIAFQLLGGACMGLVALSLQMPAYLAVSLAAFAALSIAAATHDIAADGLYIASLSAKRQAAYAGWQGAFFNGARLAAQGGVMYLAGALVAHMAVASAWSIVFGLLALAMIVIALYHTWALPPGQAAAHDTHSLRDVFDTLREVLADFFKKPGVWWAVLFIIMFRAGEAQIQTIGPLFLRDARAHGGLGLGIDQVGVAYGAAGTIAFLLGSVLGGYFTSWLGLRRAIVPLILAVNLPNLVYYYFAVAMPESMPLITALVCVEMFGYGFGFVGVILFMMQVLAPGRYQTAHYALGTGVMQLGFILFKFISGDIQVALGYEHFFLWVLICALPVLLLAFWVPMRSPLQAGQGAAQASADSAPAKA
jgi:PAT family beta-lactamase induction signal transducer AmpG